MGRHLRFPTKDGNVVAESATKGVGSKSVSEAALKRLGFGKMICQDCNALNPADADKCRKCGNTQLREKTHEYEDA